MDEAVIDRVAKFSQSLKLSANLLLDESAVMSLDSWTLYEIEDAFSLILDVEQYTNFHVLPTDRKDHPAVPHLQFVYDLLQKIHKIRLWSKPAHPLPNEETVTLRCLRNLHSLELDHIPNYQVKGLQNLRPTLRSLIVRRSCYQIGEILLHCAGDKSTEYKWEKLQIASFANNNLGALDSSLRLLPVIKELDFSYCQLNNVTAIFCLPTVTHLNLSCNKLKRLPELSEAAAKSIIYLNLSRNNLVDLRCVVKLGNLKHLDASDNLIMTTESLVCLQTLVDLHTLCLGGNPITCNRNYRIHVLKSLNNAVKYCADFLLDGTPLHYEERCIIANNDSRLMNPYLPLEPTSVSSVRRRFDSFMHIRENEEESQGKQIITSQDGVPNLSESLDKGVEIGSRKSRKKRTRTASIIDPDNLSTGTTHTLVGISPSCLNNNEEYVKSDAPVKDEVGGTAPFPSSHSDKLLEEILSATEGLLHASESETFGACPHASLLKRGTSSNSSFECPTDGEESREFSREASEEYCVYSQEGIDQPSIDINKNDCRESLSNDATPTGVVNLGEGGHNVTPSRESADQRNVNRSMSCNSQRSSDSPYSRSSSCTTISSTNRRKESDVEVLSNYSITSSIEVLRDSSSDSRDIENLNSTQNSDDVVRTDARTPPSSSTLEETTRPVRPTTLPMIESSSSGSMSGSTCTAVDHGSSSVPGTPIKFKDSHDKEGNQNESNESSGYSESHIEVEKFNIYTWVESIQETLTGYQWEWWNELSSFGQNSSDRSSKSATHEAQTAIFTESVPQYCLTTLTTTEGPKDKQTKSDCKDAIEPENISLTPPHNPINYSYENCSVVDHRLKLYAEFFLFKDDDEHLVGLIKGVILLKKTEIENEKDTKNKTEKSKNENLGPLERKYSSQFKGLVILSTLRIYVMEIMAEECSDPQTWLSEQFCSELVNVNTLYSLYHRQGIGLSIQYLENNYAFLLNLADAQRANCAFNFIIEALEECSVHPTVKELSQDQESNLKNILHGLGEDFCDISIFTVVTLLEENRGASSRFLVLTDEKLFLFHSDLRWYHPHRNDRISEQLHLNASELISNIVGIDIYSATCFSIQFYDELKLEDTKWFLHVPSFNASCHIIQAIRMPWTGIFAIDLPVTDHH